MGNVEFPITFVNRNPLNSAHVITLGRPLMQILVSIGAVGASPQIGEILPFCDFSLSCPFLSLLFCSILRRSGRIAGPIFALYGSERRVSGQDGAFCGLERWVTIFEGICHKHLPQN